MASTTDKLQALTPEQLTALNQAKVKIRMDNEQYLREHPDVSKLLRVLLRGIIQDHPRNPSTYAYKFFARDATEIRKQLDATK